MTFRLDHIFDVFFLSFSNLSIVAKCTNDRVPSLLLRVFSHLSEDFVARKSKILDQSLEELPIWILARVLNVELG